MEIKHGDSLMLHVDSTVKEDGFEIKISGSKCNQVGWVSHLHNMDLLEIMEERKPRSIPMCVHIVEHSVL